MTSDTSSKWNARYATSGTALPSPAAVLLQGEHWLPGRESERPSLTALDLACGRAANAEWLARKGYCVSAWDISENAIADIRQRPTSRITRAQVRDVSTQPPTPHSFDIIVVVRFLDRSLCSAIAAALKPGGTLFYQTFTHGLSNPNYLLKHNELPTLFSRLRIHEYHESEPDNAGKAEARLIARCPEWSGGARYHFQTDSGSFCGGTEVMSQIDIFEAMLARGQDNEMLRYTLGNAYFVESEFDKAVEHLQQAVLQKPDYSAAWRVLGRALAATGQLPEAKAAFDQGEQVAEANGDKQAAKEINVFRKRVLKMLDKP